MNSKTRYIIIAVGIFLIVMGVLVFFTQKKKSAPLPENITIKGKVEDITIANPLKNPAEIITEKDVVIAETDKYDILYFKYQEESFLITIKDKYNIQSARDLAENDLLKKLNISKEDACELNVSLGVPNFVSEKLSGKNYGLSFCPGGKSFDQ